MEKEDGTPVTDSSGQQISFTSDENGKVFSDRYFSNGTYYFRETQAPTGYMQLTGRIKLTVSENTIQP